MVYLLYFEDEFLVFIGMRCSKCLIFLFDLFELWHEVGDVLSDFFAFFLKFFDVGLILLTFFLVLSYFRLSILMYFF